MNPEEDKLRLIEARLQKVEESAGTLRMIVAFLVIIVIGLLFAMQEIKRDIPQPVLLAVAAIAVFVVITLMAGKRGPQEKTWEGKQDDPK
jgi:undecaprenyl pyrophosphate phosphatase UppP